MLRSWTGCECFAQTAVVHSFVLRELLPTGDIGKSRRLRFRKKKNIKGAPGRKAMSRKDVAVLLSQELPVLNARNAMALLEQHVLQRKQSRGMPSFVKGHGSLTGPGALAASNLLSSDPKGHNISWGAAWMSCAITRSRRS